MFYWNIAMPLIYVSSVAALYYKIKHWKVAIKTICTARLNYLLSEPLTKDLLTTAWNSQGPRTISNYNKTVGRTQSTTKREFKTVASAREANGSNSTLSTPTCSAGWVPTETPERWTPKTSNFENQHGSRLVTTIPGGELRNRS